MRFAALCALLAAQAVFVTSDAVAAPAGNTRFESYSDVKGILLREVFYDHRVTLYCAAPFDKKRRVSLPKGFKAPSDDEGRSGRVEWEHIVPAQHFGKAFEEWRSGSVACVNEYGRRYKGRKCAETASLEFRLMHADMYNLYPSIGSVNKGRSNYEFAEFRFPTPSSFGSCDMRIKGSEAQPPESSRGIIARAYKYMDWAYPRYRMSSSTRKLMDAWDKTHPVTKWECVRAGRIKRLQGNENPFTAGPCGKAGY